MASIFTHPAVPIALAVGLGNRVVPPRLLFAGILLSLLPDLDVILLYMGVPWSSVYGHRGFTHSLAFALICGVLMAVCFRQRSMQSLIFGFCIVASHAVLDAMTWGGQVYALGRVCAACGAEGYLDASSIVSGGGCCCKMVVVACAQAAAVDWKPPCTGAEFYSNR